MNQRIPAVLIPSLENYTSLIEQRLPDFMNAFYIVGSIALDEFSPHSSDVDFVAVVNHMLTDEEAETLRTIHAEIEKSHPRWKLSGMYLLPDGLGRSTDEIGRRIIFHDGKLNLKNNFEANPVTWWILKNHGISVLGSDPRALPIEIDAQDLVIWTRENMNTYWKSWTQRLDGFVVMLTDWGIQWTVLGIARQFYTIRENKIISKQRAGEYVLSFIPQQWHRIIIEAIRIRTKSPGSLYRLRLARTTDAIHFMKYIIDSSNNYLR